MECDKIIIALLRIGIWVIISTPFVLVQTLNEYIEGIKESF